MITSLLRSTQRNFLVKMKIDQTASELNFGGQDPQTEMVLTTLSLHTLPHRTLMVEGV